MRRYLEIYELTYFSISSFVEEAVEQEELSILYLLGMAAAYVHAAYALEQITKEQASELLDTISVYAACNTE